MIKLTIDGHEVEVEPGTTILEAARDELGVEIPNYCYHRDIGTDGNCRICLVEVNGNVGKLAISCQLPCGDGMTVETDNDVVKKARKGVMEFLLANHPLDCTICDQAGECPLQEYSYEYGSADSRFVEDKRNKPKQVEFSDKVMFDAERCILCTRCVRFFEEVRDDRALGVEAMGDESMITLGPNGPLTDPYQMNIIDICPVGALTSYDFRFKQRVWFMDFADTVCPGCSKGCNISAGAYQGKLLRFTPRRNADINLSWMCDDGRLSYDDYNLTDRVRGARVDGVSAFLDGVGDRLGELVGDGSGVAVLGSTKSSCEDLFALRLWAEERGIDTFWHGAATWEADGFLKQADATPNTAGAQQLGYETLPSELPALRGLIVSGDVEVPPALLANLDFLVMQSVIESPLTTEAAAIVLPARTPLEKKGTYINCDGIAQAIAPALDPGDGVPEDWAIWSELSKKIERWPSVRYVTADMQTWLAERAGQGALLATES